MNNILETRDLYHDFQNFQVLQNIHFGVREGERHAIIGPNGAGKTTFFNVVTGSYIPSHGHVFFKDKDVTRAKPYRLARMGMGRSFQITSTFQRQTPFQNIRLAVLSKNRIRFNLFRFVDKMSDITEQTYEILRQINLIEEADLPASTLSYGKQRSLEVGMALAIDPDLLMFDEPTAGMSREETHYAVELIRKLTEGKTTVVVEHDMDVVFSLADRITVLHHGEILATGKPSEIKGNEEIKKAYLGDTEV